MADIQQPFLTDINEIRRRAREKLEMGAVTENYGGDVQTAIALLNEALATEIVCVLRYKCHAVVADRPLQRGGEGGVARSTRRGTART